MSILNKVNKTLFNSEGADNKYQYSPDKYLSFQKPAKTLTEKKQELFIPDNRESYVTELWRLFVEECLSGNDEDVKALYEFVGSFDKGVRESLETKYIKLGLKNYVGSYAFVEEIKGGNIIAKNAQTGESLVLNKFKLIRQEMKNEYAVNKDLCKQVLDKLNLASAKWVKGRAALIKSFEVSAACDRAIKRFEREHGQISDILLEKFETGGYVLISGGKTSGTDKVNKKFGNIVGGGVMGIAGAPIQAADAITNIPGLIAFPLNTVSPDNVAAVVENLKNTKDEGKKAAYISSVAAMLFLFKKAPKCLKSAGKIIKAREFEPAGVIAGEVEAAKTFKHINAASTPFEKAKNFVTAGKKLTGGNQPQLQLAYAPGLAEKAGSKNTTLPSRNFKASQNFFFAAKGKDSKGLPGRLKIAKEKPANALPQEVEAFKEKEYLKIMDILLKTGGVKKTYYVLTGKSRPYLLKKLKEIARLTDEELAPYAKKLNTTPEKIKQLCKIRIKKYVIPEEKIIETLLGINGRGGRRGLTNYLKASKILKIKAPCTLGNIIQQIRKTVTDDALEAYAKKFNVTANRIKAVLGDKDAINIEIITALRETRGNQTKAGKILGGQSRAYVCTHCKKILNLPRKTLKKYAEKLGITFDKIKILCGDEDAVNVAVIKALDRANGNRNKALKEVGRHMNLSTIGRYARKILVMPLKTLEKYAKLSKIPVPRIKELCMGNRKLK